MIIITKPVPEKEKQYYSGTCPKCKIEFVCEESDFIVPILSKIATPFIHCPNTKCNGMIHKTECRLLTKDEYLNELPPLERLKHISIRPPITKIPMIPVERRDENEK